MPAKTIATSAERDPGGDQRAVRGQACGREPVQVDGHSNTGRGHRPLLPWPKENAKAVLRFRCSPSLSCRF